jgi:hypothetical protein
MPTRILIAECMQEISSFNPLPSHYENFSISTRQRIAEPARPEHLGRRCLVHVFEDKVVEVVPTYSAKANSAGPLSAKGWEQLSGEFLAAVKAKLHGIDGVYISFHGAMGAQTRARSRRISPGRGQAHGRAGHADRHFARPARHPDRPHAAADQRARNLPHLSSRRFRRYRRACRKTAAAADRARISSPSSRAS